MIRINLAQVRHMHVRRRKDELAAAAFLYRKTKPWGWLQPGSVESGVVSAAKRDL